MLSSTIRSFSPSLQRRRRPVSTTSRRFKTLSVWLSILTVLNDLHHPAQGGLRRTRTYHPWFGREVGVYGVVAKCDGMYFRGAVAGDRGDR